MTSIIERDAAARDTIRHDLGRTLFVEAGAGTGKTTALVGRIVELVLTNDRAARRPLSQIAAITFTEAAAAELRERIRVTFEERLHEARRNGWSEIVDRCELALADADVAAISTLHAFAQRLLSEFPVEVGVPPRVEVIDEVRSQIAFDRRWATFLDSLYDDPQLEEFIVRASILGVRLNAPPLRNIAQEFDDNWDRLLEVDFPERGPIRIDFTPLREAIIRVRELAQECTDEGDKLLGQIRSAESLFVRLERATNDHERLRIASLLRTITLGSRVGQRGNWVDVDDAREICRTVKDVAEAICGVVSADSVSRLAARIAAFTRESAEQRRAEGVLEFHDLLVLAQMLLRGSAEARSALSDRYRVLMLDEFQDTDPIQISLALLLASAVDETFDGTWQSLSPHSGRLFMVGDPKQSIYRFRRADISLFLAAREKFSEGEVALQRNFRTVPPVIAMVNAFFSVLMAETTEGQAAYTPLVAAREIGRADHRPLVFGGPSTDKARELREQEAADVASIVVDILQHPDQWPVRDGDGWRPPTLADITILLPTRTSMSQLSHALDERGIPFRADTGTLVYETQEIRDLLSVLRAIDDGSDQIALVAALRSPLYGCGYDDLYRFVDAGGSFDLQAAIPDAANGSIVADGIEHLRSLADRRWWDEPSQLLTRLIDERHAMALPAHGRRARDTWRRIRYVVDQARAFAEAGGGDLRDYLDWTALQGADGSRAHEPMLPEPDDIAVQIMTIHGSKGLEFPITIVSGLTTRAGNSRTIGEVVWGADPSSLPEVKISKGAKTKHFDLSKELDDEMDGPERDRLLYVALTRAKDHLAVSAHHPVKANGTAVECHGAKVFAWAESHDGELVRRFEGQTSLFAADAPTVEVDTGDPPGLPTPSDWRARHRSRIDRASRRSVMSATALARAELHDPMEEEGALDDIESEAFPPQEFRRGRAGTAIGSAVHGVLQFLDLSDPTADAIAQLADAQAWAESVPEHVETVQRAVESALEAPIVAECRTARHWKELFIAAPVGEVTIEGYIDLLVEHDDGLIVVDYKTDAVRNEADVDAKLEQYGRQGAAYAAAVAVATGRPVVDVQFVFCRPEGPIVRRIDGLDALVDDVVAAAQQHSTIGQQH